MSEKLDSFYIRNQESESNSQTQEPKLDIDSILNLLNNEYDKIVEDISVIINKKLLASGNWIPDRRLVEITTEKNLKPYTPHKLGNRKFLLPFEALFLLECRSLIIYYHQIPLSIEDAYHLILCNNRDLKLYKIFSTLSRVGYYVHQCRNNYGSNESDTLFQLDRAKRPIESEIHLPNKKMKESDNANVTKELHNYNVITNLRPLKLLAIPRINQIDKELIRYFQNDRDASSSSSYLFCIKNSSRPVELSPILSHLHLGETKPVVPLGSKYGTDGLFGTIQRESPLSFYLETSQEPVFDFFAFSSRHQMIHDFQRPLFKVVVIDDTDRQLPSIEDLCSLTMSQSWRENKVDNNKINSLSFQPIIFALISQCLNFNFYSFERIMKMENKYPRLWEQYFKD